MGVSLLNRDFHRGNHALVLDKFLNSSSKNLIKDSHNIPPVVGSLSFLGRLEEARSLFREQIRTLDATERAACRFYLGIGYARESAYERAKEYFFENLREFGREQEPLLRFYVCQGLGFFRYIQCRYKPATRWAIRSLVASNRSRFKYGQYLASDLLGYNNVLSGKISEGLKQLEESKRLATQLGKGSWQQAAEVAITCYQAQFGMNPKKILKDLDSLLNKLSDDLSYLRSSILLEKARTLSLKGELSSSTTVLNEAFRIVYASKHKRHGVLLNLRLAQNKYLMNDFFGAFSLIRNLKLDLDPKVDQQLLISLLGMERKLCQKLNLPFETSDLERLTAQSGTGVAKRMLKRKNNGTPLSNEDYIGDLFDKATLATPNHIDEIIEKEYLGILFPLLPECSSSNAIFVGLSKKWFLILENGNLNAKKAILSGQMYRLLHILAQGEVSKSSIVKSLWGYEYHPLKHDPLIYRAIGRLRAYLNLKNHWLEVTTEGYRLSNELSIHIINDSDTLPLDGKPPPPPTDSPTVQSPALVMNYRQIKLLQMLDKKDFIALQDVRKTFKVSSITASRDLSQLHQSGKITRVGRGRATHYCLPTETQI